MSLDAANRGTEFPPIPVGLPTGSELLVTNADQTIVGIIQPPSTGANPQPPAASQPHSGAAPSEPMGVGQAPSLATPVARSTAGNAPVNRPTTPELPKYSRGPTSHSGFSRAHAKLSPRLAQHLEQIPVGWRRFETNQEIGRGGCGVVTAALDHQLGREVVVKRIIDSGLSDEAIARFINEDEITGQLEHPGVVPVHELGIDEQGLPYYVMKRLQGVTLAQRIAEYRALPNGLEKNRIRQELLQRFLSVCYTLAFAHRRGIIHRDLKPANIMLGEFGETIVLDWGLARTIRREVSDSAAAQTMVVNRPLSNVVPRFGQKDLTPAEPLSESGLTPAESDKRLNAQRPGASNLPQSQARSQAKLQSKSQLKSQPKSQAKSSRGRAADSARESQTPGDSIVHRLGGSHLTMDGRVMGTAAYMAPEQALGQNDLLNEQSDVFSLGVILYEILSGVSPFQSNSIEHTIEKVAHCDYRPLSQYRAGIAKPLMAICHHALQRDQADRYRSAQELAADLQSHLVGQPVSVYAERIWERWDRWAGRHQALFRAVFFSAITVALTASIATGIISRAHQAESLAKHSAESAHAETQLALASEQHSRAQAQQRLLAARAAADHWLIDLSGNLQYYPGLQPLRHDLLEQGQHHYQALLSQLEDSPNDRAEAARCHIRLGDLSRLLQRLELAEQHYRQASEILATLLSQSSWPEPERLALRIQNANATLGQVLTAMSVAAADGANRPRSDSGDDREELLRQLAAAQTEVQRELANHPDDLETRNCLARLFWVAARLSRQTNDLSAAATQLNQALAHAEILIQQTTVAPSQMIYADSSSDSAAADNAAASSLNWLRQMQLKTNVLTESVDVLQQLQSLAEAKDAVSQLITHYERLIKQNPHRPDWLEGRSLAHMKLAEICQRQQQPSAALQAYRQAEIDLHAAWEQLLTEPFYRENQAILKANMALALQQSNQFAESEEHWIAAIEDLRWLTQVEGISDERVQRMAHCYLQLAGLILSRNGTEAAELLKQHEVLTDHLLGQDATRAPAQFAHVERLLLQSHQVADESQRRNIREALVEIIGTWKSSEGSAGGSSPDSVAVANQPTANSTHASQSQNRGVTAGHDVNSKERAQQARVYAAVARLSWSLSEFRPSATEYVRAANECWQKLVSSRTVDSSELHTAYAAWMEWHLTLPLELRQVAGDTIEIAANWTATSREHATAWQFAAWAYLQAEQSELARRAVEQARQLRSGWPQVEDELILRWAEGQMGQPLSKEKFRAARQQLELDPYRTPLRTWLLERPLDVEPK